MDLTPGRAIYIPDEELKPLRPPKTYPQTSPNTMLSANATEFVPRYSNMASHNNVQERLHRHQRQFIQDNYQQYQQPQQQQQQPPQPYNQSYANGYGHQQTQQQLSTQMNSMGISHVQERLRRPNNGGNTAGNVASGSNSTYFPQQQRGSHDYQQQNQSYHRNNKHHHNNHHNHHNHHQQRYNNHHYSQQHQYHNNQHQQQQAAGASGSSAAAAAADPAGDMQNIALDYLTTVIQCLNQNPGQFDSIATRFITIFDGMENNHYVLSIAMEDIFDESIKNPNFRYMGAKLYNLLHMLNPSKDSLFHTFLKFKLDFHKEEIQNYIKSNQQGKVRETALFLAELYMQLRGDDSRIYLIAENIVYSLKQLMQHVVAENVRCICLTLKLAGYDLSTDCSVDMKEIIAKLDEINTENPGKYPLASNVIALQKNNWGRKTSGSDGLGEGESSKPPEPLRISDDPIFYGPDGREITAEECEFLTRGTDGGGGSTDNDDDNDLDDLDPEMDEETERDYKLFLKQAKAS